MQVLLLRVRKKDLSSLPALNLLVRRQTETNHSHYICKQSFKYASFFLCIGSSWTEPPSCLSSWRRGKVTPREGWRTESWFLLAVLLWWGRNISQWLGTLGMNKNHCSLIVITAFLLVEECTEGGEDTQSSVEDRQGRKCCVEKTDYWNKLPTKLQVWVEVVGWPRNAVLCVFTNTRYCKNS